MGIWASIIASPRTLYPAPYYYNRNIQNFMNALPPDRVNDVRNFYSYFAKTIDNERIAPDEKMVTSFYGKSENYQFAG